MHRERLELPDGDFLDLDWAGRATGPVVVILHGLEGSSESNYVRGLLSAVTRRGWRGVVMHFRGCSGEPNRLAQCYTAGETRDIAHVVSVLHDREPGTPIACVGYSLGGNALLKWLGEVVEAPPLRVAVGVSVPFLLAFAAQRLGRGLSRIYQAHLLRSLRSSYERKFQHLVSFPYPLDQVGGLGSFFEFDDRITAPLHGYSGVTEYYEHASCRQYLVRIRVPTLIIHAADDPFTSPQAIPAAAELSPSVTLEISKRGGHVGFVSGAKPWRPRYWLEQRIPDFLHAHFESTAMPNGLMATNRQEPEIMLNS